MIKEEIPKFYEDGRIKYWCPNCQEVVIIENDTKPCPECNTAIDDCCPGCGMAKGTHEMLCPMPLWGRD